MQRAGKELYDQVRGAFVTNGTTLNRWCTCNGVTRQWAEKVLKGERAGVAGQQLLDRLVKSSGISK